MKQPVIIFLFLFTVIITVTGSVSAANVPTANFTSNNTNGNAPLSVQFNDTSTGNPTSWYWNFGDGSYSTDQNPIHTYTKSGIYTVRLNASNYCGTNINIKNNYIQVNPTAPVANFKTEQTMCYAPLPVDFQDLSTGEITSYEWDFGDGTTYTYQNHLDTVAHVYMKPGMYKVILTVTGPGGSNTLMKDDYIMVQDNSPPKPKANLASGLYNHTLNIILTATDDDPNSINTIYYTLDGTTPTRNILPGSNSTRIIYNGPIIISKIGTTVLKFIAADSKGNTSIVYSAKYIIDKTAPKLISTSQKNNSTISRTSTLWFKFNENIKYSVNWSKIYVKNLKTGKKVAVNKTIKNNILYLKTNTKSTSTRYQVYIPASSVKDAAGNNLTKGYTYKFKTRIS